MSNKTDLLLYFKKMFLNAKILDLKALINGDYKILIESLKFYDKRIAKRYDNETNFIVKSALIFNSHLQNLDKTDLNKFFKKYDVEYTLIEKIMTTLSSIKPNRNLSTQSKLFLDMKLYFYHQDLELNEINENLKNQKLFQTNHFILKEKQVKYELMKKKNKLLKDVDLRIIDRNSSG